MFPGFFFYWDIHAPVQYTCSYMLEQDGRSILSLVPIRGGICSI